MEEYTYADSNDIRTFCPMAMNHEDNVKCSGALCMGWIAEIGDDGKPTGRGHCGMVQGPMIEITAKFKKRDAQEPPSPEDVIAYAKECIHGQS